MNSQFKYVALILHGFDGEQSISVNGKTIQLQKSNLSLLSSISKFDPQGQAKAADGTKILSAIFNNDSDKLTIDLK